MNLAGFTIERLSAAGVLSAVPELSQILIDCVSGGAGVSFMHPLSPEKAAAFWRDRIAPRVADGSSLRGARQLLSRLFRPWFSAGDSTDGNCRSCHCARIKRVLFSGHSFGRWKSSSSGACW